MAKCRCTCGCPCQKQQKKTVKQLYEETFGAQQCVTLEQIEAFDQAHFLSAAAEFTVPPPVYECCTQVRDDPPAAVKPDSLWVGLFGNVPLWKKGSVVNFSAYLSGYPSVAHAIYAASTLWQAAQKWNAADVGVRFQWVTNTADAAFVLRYNTQSGNTLARAFFPNANDLNVIWVFGRAFQSDVVRYMDAVMEHELGHVLGLRHEFADQEGGAVLWGPRNPISVMSYNFPMRIQPSDIDSTRQLYDFTGMAIGPYEVKRYEPDN
jgi:hypothetical protein